MVVKRIVPTDPYAWYGEYHPFPEALDRRDVIVSSDWVDRRATGVSNAQVFITTIPPIPVGQTAADLLPIPTTGVSLPEMAPTLVWSEAPEVSESRPRLLSSPVQARLHRPDETGRGRPMTPTFNPALGAWELEEHGGYWSAEQLKEQFGILVNTPSPQPQPVPQPNLLPENPDMSWIEDVYDSIDTGLGGILPGGVPFGTTNFIDVMGQSPPPTVTTTTGTGVAMPTQQYIPAGEDPTKGMVYKKVCGQWRWVKQKKRRRKQLATETDVKYLALLKSILGNGEALKVWIATHPA